MVAYRKIPVIVEAFRLGYDADEPWLFSGRKVTDNRNRGWENAALQIETLEGTMDANIGDYIIKGVEGEIYPCKAHIFEATYEPTTTAPTGEGG